MRPFLIAAALCAAAPALASDPVVSECYFSTSPQAGIPGYNDEVLSTASAADCMNRCSGRLWCLSVDFERATGTCYLQPVGRWDVSLRYDYPGHPYDHFTCEYRDQ